MRANLVVVIWGFWLFHHYSKRMEHSLMLSYTHEHYPCHTLPLPLTNLDVKMRAGQLLCIIGDVSERCLLSDKCFVPYTWIKFDVITRNLGQVPATGWPILGIRATTPGPWRSTRTSCLRVEPPCWGRWSTSTRTSRSSCPTERHPARE